jgi:hypothetical protein
LKLIDVARHPDEEFATLLQPLEKISYFLGRSTVSKMTPEFEDQLHLILELEGRICFDPLSQRIQMKLERLAGPATYRGAAALSVTL